MKPFGGYVPKDKTSGEEEYAEFYRAEDVDKEVGRFKSEIEKKQQEIREHEEKITRLEREIDTLKSELRTDKVIARDHGRELQKGMEVIAALQEALGFYADKSNWITVNGTEGDSDFGKFPVEHDRGKRARKALKSLNPPPV
jgi:septal ring factor EnvC (AmiA/AmiB activator)